MNPKFPKEEANRALEERIEELVEEISGLIQSSQAGHQEELKEYAISLLRGEEGIGRAKAHPVEVAEAGPAFNPFGLAIPLFLIGGLLLFLFPPVGVLLLLTGMAMGGWGVLWTFFSRSK